MIIIWLLLYIVLLLYYFYFNYLILVYHLYYSLSINISYFCAKEEGHNCVSLCTKWTSEATQQDKLFGFKYIRVCVETDCLRWFVGELKERKCFGDDNKPMVDKLFFSFCALNTVMICKATVWGGQQDFPQTAFRCLFQKLTLTDCNNQELVCVCTWWIYIY